MDDVRLFALSPKYTSDVSSPVEEGIEEVMKFVSTASDRRSVRCPTVDGIEEVRKLNPS